MHLDRLRARQRKRGRGVREARRVELLRDLDHPNVVRLVDFFDEPEYFFIVTDMVRGGDLFMRIIDKARYMENEARDVVKTLLEVLDYLHKRGVAHRDIKVRVMCGGLSSFVLLLQGAFLISSHLRWTTFSVSLRCGYLECLNCTQPHYSWCAISLNRTVTSTIASSLT